MFDEKLFRETFSQVHAPEETLSEVLKMTKKKNSNVFRFTRMIVIAAIITVMLATTAFAYVGFTQYENPMQMLKTFFGSNGYHVDEGGFMGTESYYDQHWDVVLPTVEQVPMDEQLAQQQVAPYISDVGKTITYGDYSLTVEAHLFDSATGCGCIYYKLENPNGIMDYKLQYDGEVSWLNGGKIEVHGAHGKEYIIEDETTDTVLSIAHYYCDADDDSITISFQTWILGEPGTVTEEAWHEFESARETLTLPLNDGGGMKAISISDGLIQVSPIAMKFKISELEFLGNYETDGSYVPPVDTAKVWNLSIRYQDDTEYIIERNNPYIINFSYALGDYTHWYYTFNRLIDVDQIEAVTINDVEFTDIDQLSQD